MAGEGDRDKPSPQRPRRRNSSEPVSITVNEYTFTAAEHSQAARGTREPMELSAGAVSGDSRRNVAGDESDAIGVDDKYRVCADRWLQKARLLRAMEEKSLGNVSMDALFKETARRAAAVTRARFPSSSASSSAAAAATTSDIVNKAAALWADADADVDSATEDRSAPAPSVDEAVSLSDATNRIREAEISSVGFGQYLASPSSSRTVELQPPTDELLNVGEGRLTAEDSVWPEVFQSRRPQYLEVICKCYSRYLGALSMLLESLRSHFEQPTIVRALDTDDEHASDDVGDEPDAAVFVRSPSDVSGVPQSALCLHEARLCADVVDVALEYAEYLIHSLSRVCSPPVEHTMTVANWRSQFISVAAGDLADMTSADVAARVLSDFTARAAARTVDPRNNLLRGSQVAGAPMNPNVGPSAGSHRIAGPLSDVRWADIHIRIIMLLVQVLQSSDPTSSVANDRLEDPAIHEIVAKIEHQKSVAADYLILELQRISPGALVDRFPSEASSLLRCITSLACLPVQNRMLESTHRYEDVLFSFMESSASSVSALSVATKKYVRGKSLKLTAAPIMSDNASSLAEAILLTILAWMSERARILRNSDASEEEVQKFVRVLAEYQEHEVESVRLLTTAAIGVLGDFTLIIIDGSVVHRAHIHSTKDRSTQHSVAASDDSDSDEGSAITVNNLTLGEQRLNGEQRDGSASRLPGEYSRMQVLSAKLAERSRYFARMLGAGADIAGVSLPALAQELPVTGDYAEARTKSITIVTEYPGEFEQLIHYFYTGEIGVAKHGGRGITADNAVGLLSVAQQYDVPQVKKLAERWLLQHYDSCSDLWQAAMLFMAADAAEAPRLRSAVLRYVTNKFLLPSIRRADISTFERLKREFPALLLALGERELRFLFQHSIKHRHWRMALMLIELADDINARRSAQSALLRNVLSSGEPLGTETEPGGDGFDSFRFKSVDLFGKMTETHKRVFEFHPRRPFDGVITSLNRTAQKQQQRQQQQGQSAIDEVGATSSPPSLTPSSNFAPVCYASSIGTGSAQAFIGRTEVSNWTRNEPRSWFAVDIGPNVRVKPAAYTLRYASSGAYCFPRNWVLQGTNNVKTIAAIAATSAGGSGTLLPSASMLSPTDSSETSDDDEEDGGARGRAQKFIDGLPAAAASSDKGWVTLSIHDNEMTLNQPWDVHTWTIRSPRTAFAATDRNSAHAGYYRCFRIIATGQNAYAQLKAHAGLPSASDVDEWSHVLVVTGFEVVGELLEIRIHPSIRRSDVAVACHRTVASMSGLTSPVAGMSMDDMRAAAQLEKRLLRDNPVEFPRVVASEDDSESAPASERKNRRDPARKKNASDPTNDDGTLNDTESDAIDIAVAGLEQAGAGRPTSPAAGGDEKRRLFGKLFNR